MSRILSNGPNRSYVIQALEEMIQHSKEVYLAAPYFDKPDPIISAIKQGKIVKLLVGLSSATDPDALAKVRVLKGVSVRYLTHRFHAKIYVFDDAALLGSANLTNAGLIANREAVIRLDRNDDRHDIDEVRSLFLELWNPALVLTEERYKIFRDVWRRTRGKNELDADAEILKVVEPAEPPNVNVASMKISKDRIFKNSLHRLVYEKYRPAFREVIEILELKQLRRGVVGDLGPEHEVNRFLNWVRLVHASGDTWSEAPIRTPAERRIEIERLGNAWLTTDDDRIPEDYRKRLTKVRAVLGDQATLEAATHDKITEALVCLHAFSEQLRFVKGGLSSLPTEFWKINNNDRGRVTSVLSYLLHGSGDFVDRLHDVLYHPRYKIGLFGKFCALELFGAIWPDNYPPMNGRMAKALRYLGFDVSGS